MTSSKDVASARPASRRWTQLDDAALLKLRFKDLGLSVASTPVQRDVIQVHAELARRGIRFRPHMWFSTEWFSPDGVPGVAIPFFLGHPRLRRLESKLMEHAEGGSRPWRLRLLRHEIGHAIDTAYRLRRRPDWRAVFGRASLHYPRTYAVEPRSRDYVLHLEHWYAQSHPTEDFAETFAVWLQPRARWRRDYTGWPALEKLEFVDGLMTEIAARTPRNRDRSRVAPLDDNKRTLGEHYRRRAREHDHEGDPRYDAWLRRAFPSTDVRHSSAERFLREAEAQLQRKAERSTGQHPYLIRETLGALQHRAAQLGLRTSQSKRDDRQRALRLVERAVADVVRRNQERYSV